MIKTMIIAAAAKVLSVGSAWAQSTSYPNGQYLGSARTQTYPFGGASTSYFGANGQYLGNSHRTR